MRKVPNQRKYDIVMIILSSLFSILAFIVMDKVSESENHTVVERIGLLVMLVIFLGSFALILSYQFARIGLYKISIGCLGCLIFFAILLIPPFLIGPAIGASADVKFLWLPIGLVIGGLVASAFISSQNNKNG